MEETLRSSPPSKNAAKSFTAFFPPPVLTTIGLATVAFCCVSFSFSGFLTTNRSTNSFKLVL
ncbi:hypothetical protein BDM02DRAFT_3115705 [Thelephora ganbajun]|uniref:Uncharacterized protein n=1 Tax=Thelephora ganbajun TaxID=370292 RepID=A0ACB6ZF99_THEGA|nr:hypothetical protein BDM02DRAFT_3115705 [Thelephora ganbajun]